MLNLKWLSSQTDPFDATIVSTVGHDYSQYYAYGHAYYQTIFRATTKNIGGVWPGLRMAGVNAVIFHACRHMDTVQAKSGLPSTLQPAFRYRTLPR